MLTEKSALRDNPGDGPDTRHLVMHRSFASHQQMAIRMTLGNVHLRFNRSLNKLREKSRPFVGHALGGYSEGTISYHAIPKFMIQTGDTPPEAKTFGVKKLRMSPEMIRVTTVRELCACPTRARVSGIQLFITMATPWRDKKHTIFGRVVGGLEYIHAIEITRTSVTIHLGICINIVNIDVNVFSSS